LRRFKPQKQKQKQKQKKVRNNCLVLFTGMYSTGAVVCCSFYVQSFPNTTYVEDRFFKYIRNIYIYIIIFKQCENLKK
jgi:hypothetical protein